MSKITITISPKLATPEDRGWSKVIRKDKDIWTTKDGRKIPIEEMDNEHIQNAIRFMHRNGRSGFDSFWALVKEINKRGFLMLIEDNAVYFK